MKYLTLIATLAFVACDEHLADEAQPSAQVEIVTDAAGLVSPALPLTCGPVGAGATPAVQICVDDETGCHYFVGQAYGIVPRIGADGQHMGCREIVPEVVTVGDAGKETIVYLEPTREAP